MTNKELEDIHTKHKGRVQVACDEYHAHNGECLVPANGGSQDDVTICRLVDQLLEVRLAMRELAEKHSGVVTNPDACLNCGGGPCVSRMTIVSSR